MRLTPETDREAVASHVEGAGERAALRTAETRRDRLERAIRISSGIWDLEVRIDPEHPPAAIRPQTDGITESEATEIVVSGTAVPQPVTDYPDREWDLLVQQALAIHEVGHLKHTAFGDLQARLDELPDGYESVAGQIWNAFEDGAIEAGIRDRWPNYGRMLAVLRANCFEERGPGIEDPSGGLVFPVAHAVVAGILDRTTYDSGVYERLLDPTDDGYRFHSGADQDRFERSVADRLDAAVESVMSMPDPIERNRRVFEFVDAIRPVIDAAEADGRGQLAARTGNAWGMPDDAALSRSERTPETLGVLAETTTAASSSDSSRNTGVESLASDDARSPPDDGEDSSDRSDGSESNDRRTDEVDMEDELSRTLGEAVRDQDSAASSQRDAVVRNLSRMQAAIQSASSQLETDGVVLPEDDPEYDEAVYEAAVADGKRLARLLRNRFQKQQKRSVIRNTRRGRLDPTALHRHATGETHLKFRRELPDERDHHCLFVLDRSGSMSQYVHRAERAMGALVFALESVDVDVGVIELLDKTVRLAKPIDREADRVPERLFHGEATGGTPLSDTLHIARERLKHEQGNRFLFVITDGRPADPDRYRAALDRFAVPVVGIHLAGDRAAGTDQFHRQVTVDPETEELRRALRQLVQEVLFE